jgi:predicted N-acyltransferase
MIPAGARVRPARRLHRRAPGPNRFGCKHSMTTVSSPLSTSPADYHSVVGRSIREIDWDEWNRLRDAKSDPFMDPRYILAVENAMGSVCHFRHVLIRDAENRPAAAACLCSYTIDGAVLAEGEAKKVAALVNRVAPVLLRIRVLLCGLPVSSGSSHLRFAPHADRAAVLRHLEGIVQAFAREERSHCVVYKEFSSSELGDLASLQHLGYRRAESLPMNCVPAEYRSFDDYLSRIGSAKRRTIRRSREKFATFGFKVEHRSGGEGAADLYTDEVHKLYEAVLERAAVRFESLPADYFRELARQLPENTLFTFVSREGQIVAFAATLLSDELFDQMFIGLDYDLNRECDLYFNVFFEAIGAAFERGARRIYVGQTSDDFKHQKLSTYQVPLTLYAKGLRWITRGLLATRFDWFFPPRPMKYPAPQTPLMTASR